MRRRVDGAQEHKTALFYRNLIVKVVGKKMEEKAKLYWTHGSKRKRITRGIIILTDKGISTYSKKKKLLFFVGDEREIKGLEFDFKDIINVTIEKKLLGGQLLHLFLTKEAFEKKRNELAEKGKSGKLAKKLFALESQNKFSFYIDKDSKSEALRFADLANESIQNARPST